MRFLFRLVMYFSICCLPWSLTLGQVSSKPGKQVKYLSGTDNTNTKAWSFYCSGGRESGYWTTIEVPSCWEQEGFGSYNYGRDYHTYGKDFRYAGESGFYKTEFDIPDDWEDKKIYLVFEGSMTDTEVKINGEVAGPKHQGAFYEFRYDITDKLFIDRENVLEVKVDKMSSDKSVNRAERYADYWIFGGIFRPVYLEVFPKEHIERLAINARADGNFSADVFFQGTTSRRKLQVEILNSNGITVAEESMDIKPNTRALTLTLHIDNPELWTAETPHLYRANFVLSKGSEVLYQSSEKFGFRTVEVRQGDGIYINGTKLKMKGVNRHSFWPETGRTLSPEINLMDVQLIKEMNMNAVRCAHYPPDKEFLAYCDSLGLYVINELAGWHNAYSTNVGKKLVREMVIRDVNHPSIIFWSNGNEGGHNMELVDEFAKYDPSNRPVIHAHHKKGNALQGIDCNHYEDYYSMRDILKDSLIYMPTEFLHAQNDGGGGAGLNDFWNLMRESEKSAGGFLWAFIDEGIVRTDRNNIIDVNGVNAPDGLLGPHREKEGSFYSIREIFSPIYIPMKEVDESFKGVIELENRHDYLNLSSCSFKWKLVRYNLPGNHEISYKTLEEGAISGPDIKAGTWGDLLIPLPQEFETGDALVLEAYDMAGKKLMDWIWKIRDNHEIVRQLRANAKGYQPLLVETDSTLEVGVNGINILLSKEDGSLIWASNDRNRFKNFGNGPRLVSGNASFESLVHYPDEYGYRIDVSYSGDLKYARWLVCKDGWVEMEYEYSLSGKYKFSGVSFDFPEDHVISAKWLGNGPCRVWKNRMQGGTTNVWENAYNNTQTGYYPWIYPEFKGYYSNIAWMELNTVEGKFIMATDTDDLFIRLFDFYALPGIEPHPALPPSDISFLEHIPPIGTKMSTKINYETDDLGPKSELNSIDNTFKRKVYFYFGTLEAK